MALENGLFIYASEKMHRIKEIIEQVANTDVTVLIKARAGSVRRWSPALFTGTPSPGSAFYKSELRSPSIRVIGK